MQWMKRRNGLKIGCNTSGRVRRLRVVEAKQQNLRVNMRRKHLRKK